jgi:hypothetical protein
MASGNSNALLAHAAQTGKAQLVARLLGEGRDVNEADETGFTALVYASFVPRAGRRLFSCSRARASRSTRARRTGPRRCTYLASQNGHVEVFFFSWTRARASRSTRPRRTGPRRCTSRRRKVTSRLCSTCSRTRTITCSTLGPATSRWCADLPAQTTQARKHWARSLAVTRPPRRTDTDRERARADHLITTKRLGETRRPGPGRTVQARRDRSRRPQRCAADGPCRTHAT